LAPGRFLLIAGEDGQAWYEAARQLAAEADVPLDALRIGRLERPPGRPHRRAQPDPWAQTVCSARVGRFLTGAGAAQR
jgi:hypothetical protein